MSCKDMSTFSYIQSMRGERSPSQSDKKRLMCKVILATFLLAMTNFFIGCSPNNKTRDVSSFMNGFYSSPHYLAQREYQDYLDTYDEDHSLLKANSKNESNIPVDYFDYHCYTWDMVNKVDEIRNKYGLGLLTNQELLQYNEGFSLLNRLNIPSVFRNDAEADSTCLGGYYYAEGTFQIDCTVTLTGENAKWKHQIMPSYRYSLKNYFDPVYVVNESIQNSEQWIYTTSDGTDVLLSMNDKKCVILCTREDAFITVELGSNEQIPKEALEQISEIFDFSIIPQPKITTSTDESNPSNAETESLQTESPKYADAFADCIDRYLDTSYYPNEPTYSFVDLNKDGNTELIVQNIHEDGTPYIDIFSVKNGEAIQLNVTALNYLCEGNILEEYNQIGDWERHFYYELCDDGLRFVDSVSFNHSSQSWARNPDPAWFAPAVEITELEALEVISAYPRISLEMTPCSDYPRN